MCVCAAAGIRDNLDAFAVISLKTGLMFERSLFDAVRQLKRACCVECEVSLRGSLSVSVVWESGSRRWLPAAVIVVAAAAVLALSGLLRFALSRLW